MNVIITYYDTMNAYIAVHITKLIYDSYRLSHYLMNVTI